MSSFRNAAPRREHWERGQLVGRGKLGLLEKRKDYQLRAKNYHAKEKRLLVLREKARFKNPDEFYFAMQGAGTIDGIHKMKKSQNPLRGVQQYEGYSEDMIQLLKTQDWNYLKNQVVIQRNKIKKLEIDHSWLKYLGHNDSDTDDNAKELNGPSHILFNDEEEEDLETGETHGEYDSDIEMSAPVLTSLKDLQVDKGLKNKITREWEALKKRLVQLELAEKELLLKNTLTTAKGRRKKLGKDKSGLPIYKWNLQRSK